jgi:hypothetical protein
LHRHDDSPEYKDKEGYNYGSEGYGYKPSKVTGLLAKTAGDGPLLLTSIRKDNELHAECLYSLSDPERILASRMQGPNVSNCDSDRDSVTMAIGRSRYVS